MTFPTIHLNGTNPGDLLEMQCEAMNAVREAINKIQYAGPNGRDYYPQGPHAFEAAREEHEGRILALRNVLAELESIAEHLAKHVK